MSAFSPEYLWSRLQSWGTPGRYLVAYSGGGDSQALLAALAALRPRLGAPLAAMHVCHGLEVGAGAWIEHCGRCCGQLDVPLTLLEVVVDPQRGESLEAVARIRRYRALARSMRAGDLLLTAHHQEDQAETLLLQLLRGSGVGGLAAMPGLAPFPPGLLGRPLLGVRRAELRRYAEASGLDWVEDPSNQDLGRDRNFLRHRVLPRIAERWPAWSQTLARSAGHCAEAKGLIEALARGSLEGCRGALPWTLSIPSLAALEVALRRAVLRQWILDQGLPPPDARHLERILGEVMGAAGDRNPLVAWPGCEIRRYRHQLFALSPLPAPPRGVLDWTGERLTLPAGLGEIRALPVEGPGVAPRLWQQASRRVTFGAGELCCRPRGQDHHRSLKKLYQGQGVPAWLRPYLPLVLLDAELVAIGDGWSCEGPWSTPRGGIALSWVGHPWPDLWQALSGSGGRNAG